VSAMDAEERARLVEEAYADADAREADEAERRRAAERATRQPEPGAMVYKEYRAQPAEPEPQTWSEADAKSWQDFVHNTVMRRTVPEELVPAIGDTINFSKATHRLYRFCQPLGRLRAGVNTAGGKMGGTPDVAARGAPTSICPKISD